MRGEISELQLIHPDYPQCTTRIRIARVLMDRPHLLTVTFYDQHIHYANEELKRRTPKGGKVMTVADFFEQTGRYHYQLHSPAQSRTVRIAHRHPVSWSKKVQAVSRNPYKALSDPDLAPLAHSMLKGSRKK